jgi:sulfotransferase
MTRTIHFLAGLPRSGNTLLSSLLNQNPKIYSSPLSSLNTAMYNLKFSLEYQASTRNIENSQRIHKTLHSFVDNFYSDVDEEIIFDREKYWTAEYNLENIYSYITKSPKIIYTVRDIPSILSSLISINSNRYIKELQDSDCRVRHYYNTNDALCDYLMEPSGMLDTCLMNLAYGLLPEHRENILLIEYDDLVSNTQNVLNQIYDFIKIDRYTHDLENIQKLEVDDEWSVGDPITLHKVGKTITKSKTNPENILSDFMIKKYSGMEFWRKDSLLKIKNPPN